MADIVIEDITFASNGGSAQGYLARPDDGAQHPGLILIQEWWGLNAHIKDVARRYANAGYVALAPDLFHGKMTTEPNEAQKLAMSLDQAQVARDLHGATQTLQAMTTVDPKRIGITGFCMGGLIAMVYAAQAGTNAGAVVAFYPGGYDPSEADVAAIQCPALLIYGSKDHSTPSEKREQLRKMLTDQGKTFDMVVYQGADHAFFNDTRPEVHDATAAADAWNRALDWFGRYLK
jgi:carboxymethylenebutenolidase